MKYFDEFLLEQYNKTYKTQEGMAYKFYKMPIFEVVLITPTKRVNKLLDLNDLNSVEKLFKFYKVEEIYIPHINLKLKIRSEDDT